MGPMAGLDGCGKFCVPKGSDPRTVQPVTSRCTAYSIPGHTVFKYESQFCVPTGSDPGTVQPVTTRCTAYSIPGHTVFGEPQFCCAIVKLRKATLSFVIYVYPSVRPHTTTRLTLDGFSWNFIYEYFLKICRENLISIKIWQENGYFTWRPMYFYDNIWLNS
jgi:hypothetical protein